MIKAALFTILFALVVWHWLKGKELLARPSIAGPETARERTARYILEFTWLPLILLMFAIADGAYWVSRKF